MALDISMANVSTLASFVKLSWQHDFLFCSPSKALPTKPRLFQGGAIDKSHSTHNLADELLRVPSSPSQSTNAQCHDHTHDGTLSLTS